MHRDNDRILTALMMVYALAELGELATELTPQPKARRASRKNAYVPKIP